MLTDWVLIRRLAEELKLRIRGARVDDAGLFNDGRIAILFRARGTRLLLAIDLFASPPLMTLEEGELGVLAEPGFLRTLARALKSMVLSDVTSRSGDRVLRLTFATRSRFGVGEQLELYVELVPRFGNVVLVKDGTVVAARKEFAPAENPNRSVQAGAAYVLPPLPALPRTLPAQPAESPLEYFAQLRVQQSARAGSERVASRRRAIFKRLDERERRLRDELAALAQKRYRAKERDALKEAGETVFATLHELHKEHREEAKERAAKLFAEYKRLAKSLPHVDAREHSVRASLEAVETLRWEAERAVDDDLDAVETAVAELGPKQRTRPPVRTPRHKRALLEIRTPRGSRIVVGRSPLENAELTFRYARPNDLWFHARGIPGAHVILGRDDRAAPPQEDLERAASLAAFHSRGQSSASVAVDYTLRKHVRKQRAAPPGLVWYTRAKTIVVEPRAIETLL